MADRTAGSSTVLVVDDDATVRSAIRKTLVRGGWSVEEAASGQEAIETVRARPSDFDLAVVDVMLEAESGIEVAEQLYRLSPALTFLFVSGYTDLDVRAASVPKERYAFIGKPLSVVKLLEEANALRVRSRRGAISR